MLDVGAAAVVASGHFDGHVRRVGHDVVDGRALLRLGYQRLDVLALRVGIDLVLDLDDAEAVADVAIDAKDALDIHIAFDRRRDRSQLNLAVLRDCRDPGGQAARQADQAIFDGGRAPVLRSEDFGMVGVELERPLASLLLAQAEETLDRRVAVGAVLPFAGSTPFEFGSFRRLGQRITGRDQRVNIYAIIYSVSHGYLPGARRGLVDNSERYCIAFVRAASFDSTLHAPRIGA